MFYYFFYLLGISQSCMLNCSSVRASTGQYAVAATWAPFPLARFANSSAGSGPGQVGWDLFPAPAPSCSLFVFLLRWGRGSHPGPWSTWWAAVAATVAFRGKLSKTACGCGFSSAHKLMKLLLFLRIAPHCYCCCTACRLRYSYRFKLG